MELDIKTKSNGENIKRSLFGFFIFLTRGQEVVECII